MPNQPHADSPEPDGIFDLIAAWKAWALLIRNEQCILQPTSNLLSTKQGKCNAGLVLMGWPGRVKRFVPAQVFAIFFDSQTKFRRMGRDIVSGAHAVGITGPHYGELIGIPPTPPPPQFFEACKAPIWCNTPSSNLHSELAGDYIDQPTNLQSSFTPKNAVRFTKLSPAFDSLQETHLQSKTSNAIGSCTSDVPWNQNAEILFFSPQGLWRQVSLLYGSVVEHYIHIISNIWNRFPLSHL